MKKAAIPSNSKAKNAKQVLGLQSQSRPKLDRPCSERQIKRGFGLALELFNRRWVLRIIWELRGEALTFRELQAACGDISTSVLNLRLTELRAALLVMHEDGKGYRLTEHGLGLIQAAEPLAQWVPGWATQLEASEPLES